jgi:hypothetical protein
MELVLIEAAAKLDKKELQDRGAQDAKQALDSGNYGALGMTVTARKAAEYLASFIKELDSPAREELSQENYKEAEIFGSKLSLSSTGARLDYEADPIYRDLKERLKEREELLKLAHKSKDAIFDQYAAEVPKVPLKYQSREVLKIRL